MTLFTNLIIPNCIFWLEFLRSFVWLLINSLHIYCRFFCSNEYILSSTLLFIKMQQITETMYRTFFLLEKLWQFTCQIWHIRGLVMKKKSFQINETIHYDYCWYLKKKLNWQLDSSFERHFVGSGETDCSAVLNNSENPTKMDVYKNRWLRRWKLAKRDMIVACCTFIKFLVNHECSENRTRPENGCTAATRPIL